MNISLLKIVTLRKHKIWAQIYKNFKITVSFRVVFKSREKIISNAPKNLRKAREDALNILEKAIERADAYNAVKSAVTIKGKNLFIDDKRFDIDKDIYLIGFGKASVPMARALLKLIDVNDGIVITPFTEKIGKIKVFVGGHPIPDERSIKGTKKIMEMVRNCKSEDLLISLISGGGSSLLCHPIMELEELQEVTRMLLKSGCDINELNIVRKHLSFIKGGRLAKETGATIISLIISDIVEDPIQSIASGPTHPDSTTLEDAKKILEKYGLWKKPMKELIENGIEGKIEETPTELNNVHNFVIANNELACRGAIEEAEKAGYYTKLLTTRLVGEARIVGRDLAKYAKIFPRNKVAIISGGETTVTVEGNGKGGRNQELVLGAIKEIAGKDIVIASCGTDGIDGQTDAAGAIADGTTLKRASKKNIDPDEYLKENDSYTFFKQLGDLLITGQTGTNVMDVQVIII